MTIQKTITQQAEYDGVTRWHNHRITGKGVNVWNMEGKGDHAETTYRRVKDSAPDSNVFNYGLSMSSDAKEVFYSHVNLEDGTKIDTEDFIKSRKIKLITRSIGSSFSMGGASFRFWENLQDKYNLIIFNSAGNEGSDQRENENDIAIRVGACGLNKYGVPVRDNYSAVGEIDFIDFRGIWSGTSFAAPYLCGKTALLIEKYGHGLTQEDVYSYLVEHCEDLGDAGKDRKNGHGLPILGDANMKIKMTIGSKVAYVDGKKVLMEQEPFIMQDTGRTVSPVRFVAETLGAEVEWNDKTKEITITK